MDTGSIPVRDRKVVEMSYVRRFELFLRYNRYIDLHPTRFLIILFTPYLACILSLFLIPNEYRIKLIPIYILCSIVVIISMILRQTNITFSLTDDSKRMNERRLVFSNKWLKRGTSRFMYIKPIDNMHIDIYHYNLPDSYQVKEYQLPEFSYYKSYWGDWDLSSTIPASKEDIEKHNLSWLEAKILLGQKNG